MLVKALLFFPYLVPGVRRSGGEWSVTETQGNGHKIVGFLSSKLLSNRV